MTAFEQAKQDACAALAAVLPPDAPAPSDADFVKPPQADMGDLSFPCFGLAKASKSNPAALAKDLAGKIAPSGLIAEAKAVGPYLNFFFDKKAFSAAVIKEVVDRAGEYGNASKRDEKVLIEYGSPNTHKEIHVGHLRNFALGLAVERLLRAAGADVTAVNYIGDVGAHVAKWLWYVEKKMPGEFTSSARSEMPTFGKMYTEAIKLYESDEEKYKPEVSAVLQALELHDKKWEELWLQTRDMCLAQIDVIFKQLDIHFVRTYLESEVEGPGKALVQELLAKGIAKEGERGAKIVDLEPEGLGVMLVLKSDGTALYSTKELALAKLKFKEFPETMKSLHVVDNRQSLYFKQLFVVLKKMGFDKSMAHLAYDFVTLEEGAMSSRKGNIVTYEDFRDRMIDMVANETRSRREEWSAEKVAEVAWVIAEGAMKFGMLKQDNDRPIVFNMEAALSFDGFTGPYIQYAHARLCSILARAGDDGAEYETSDDSEEYTLLRLVADFPATVLASAASYRPSLLAQYLFDLAQASNDFYRDAPVLAAEPRVRARRLAVIRATKIALTNGLSLLGIRAPEEM